MKYFKLNIFFFFFSISAFTYGEINPDNIIIAGFDQSYCLEKEDTYFELQCIHGPNTFGPEGYSVCPEKACTQEEMNIFLALAVGVSLILLGVICIFISEKNIRKYFVTMNAFVLLPSYWIFTQSDTSTQIYRNILLVLVFINLVLIIFYIVKILGSNVNNKYLLLFSSMIVTILFHLSVLSTVFYFSY